MNTTQTVFGTVLVLSNDRGGGVLAGQSSVLSAICRGLGFKNRCEDGRIYLTPTKMARLGLAGAAPQLPGWHSMSTAELARMSSEVR